MGSHLIAIVATVRTLLRVRGEVPLQRLGRSEALAAQSALALGHVDVGIAIVLLERGICVVGRAAQVAHIGPLDLGVQLHVPLQVGLQREAVMANVALEKVVALVNADDVLVQGVLRLELLPAHLANGPVGLVARLLEVLLQLLLRKLQPAFAAGKC